VDTKQKEKGKHDEEEQQQPGTSYDAEIWPCKQLI